MLIENGSVPNTVRDVWIPGASESTSSDITFTPGGRGVGVEVGLGVLVTVGVASMPEQTMVMLVPLVSNGNPPPLAKKV
jgi:hypothetical protein